jgi:hypothetical protein
MGMAASIIIAYGFIQSLSLPAPTFLNTNAAFLPVTFDELEKPRIKRIHVYYSTDRGRAWTKIAATTPDSKGVQCFLPDVGEYVFGMRIEYVGGFTIPLDESDIKIQSRVYCTKVTVLAIGYFAEVWRSIPYLQNVVSALDLFDCNPFGRNYVIGTRFLTLPVEIPKSEQSWVKRVHVYYSNNGGWSWTWVGVANSDERFAQVMFPEVGKYCIGYRLEHRQGGFYPPDQADIEIDQWIYCTYAETKEEVIATMVLSIMRLVSDLSKKVLTPTEPSGFEVLLPPAPAERR